jgi:hypothetical protein
MATLKTSNVQNNDWVCSFALPDTDTVRESHIPCPFSGYVENILYAASGDIGAGDSVVTFALNNGSTLATITLLDNNVAGVPVTLQYNAMDSPIKFGEGDTIVMASDGGAATAGIGAGITLVLKQE